MASITSGSGSVGGLGSKRTRDRKTGIGNCLKFVFVLLVSGLSFYIGTLTGYHIGFRQGENECADQVHQHLKKQIMIEKQQPRQQNIRMNQNIPEEDERGGDNAPRFGVGVSAFVHGMSLVNREQFAKKYDTGVPLDETNKYNNYALLFYGGEASLPTSDPYKALEAASNTRIPIFDDVDVALENCETLNIILTQPKQPDQCIAIMGQYESYHVQKFMRLPDPEIENAKYEARGEKPPWRMGNDKAFPLRHVNRNAKSNGQVSVKIPNEKIITGYWKELISYLNSLEDVLEQLKPIAEKVAIQNTIVVMVCNYGQSELLMNFVCNCKSKNIDISNVLVFATDTETKELAENMGLTTFYDEITFGRMPKEAAKRYADRTFAAVMMAKVYCVHMINSLGYDLLFQDVDVIWYRNPLPYFHDNGGDNGIQKFDMYFQDDGNHASFYAPYSANTGFYYVRNNERTRYFFNTLLLSGDLITINKSHQVALISILAEHASMYGLHVKVLHRNEFPGGVSYHRGKDYMKTLFNNQKYNMSKVNTDSNHDNNANNYDPSVDPHIFHMSWTKNKDNKINFFQQMGEWYFDLNKCHTKENDENHFSQQGKQDFVNRDNCCFQEPQFVCHFKDKPSLYRCDDSTPIIDNRDRNWWS